MSHRIIGHDAFKILVGRLRDDASHREGVTTRSNVLLNVPSPTIYDLVEMGRPLPPPPMLPAARARCAASTEPLVPVENSVQGFDAYAQLEILPARLLQVRNSTLDRLRVADAALPPGFSLVVLDGWRTIAEQKALVSYYEKLGPTHGYVASVRDDAMRSPHTTGGAVDLTLMFQGKPLALGTDFDSFDPQAHYDAFEATDGVVRRLRRTLGWAMLEAGFVPYPLEWWHWSYGEDVWACAHKRPALFDIIEAK